MIISKHIKRFFNNLSWLILLQGFSYLISLLTMPIIIYKFGYKNTGIIFTVQSVILAIATLGNYSLNYYIPTKSKKISTNKKYFNQLWFLSLSVRSLLNVTLSIIVSFVISIFYADYFIIWLVSLILLLPKIINPNLFYNALEENKKILLIGFFSKFLFLLSLLLLSNYYYVNFFLGFTELLVLLIWLIKEKWSFYFASFKAILNFLNKTAPLFLVNFFSALKPALVNPILAYFFGSSAVTTFVLADKIINVYRGISGASYISFYPIFNKEKWQESFINFKNILSIASISFVLLGMIWFLTPLLILALNNFKPNNEAVRLTRVLAFSIPISFLIIPFFSFFLEKKKWFFILFISAIQLFVFCIIIATFHKTPYQISVAIVLSEFSLFLGYLWYFIIQKK